MSQTAGDAGPPPEIQQGRENPSPICLEEGELHIRRIDLDATASRENADIPLLAADERERAARLRLPSLRRRFIARRSALRRTLAGYLGIDPAQIRFRYGPFGKPGLENPAADEFAFNASHSESRMVVAVGRFTEIGIDLERIRYRADLRAVAAKYFTVRERSALSELSKREAPAGFFSIWTRKEALIKAVGTGFSTPLDSLDVAPLSGRAGSSISIPGQLGAARWHTYAPDIWPGFACAVAVPARAKRLWIYDDAELA